MIGLLCFLLAVLISPFKSKLLFEAENAALRHQLIILPRRLQGRIRLTCRSATAPLVGNLYEASRVKRLFRDQHFFLPFVSRGLRERKCLAATSGQPPEPGGSRRKARGVDGESACQATMVPGPLRRKCNCVLRCC
jgi:hypothetical protein